MNRRALLILATIASTCGALLCWRRTRVSLDSPPRALERIILDGANRLTETADRLEAIRACNRVNAEEVKSLQERLAIADRTPGFNREQERQKWEKLDRC